MSPDFPNVAAELAELSVRVEKLGRDLVEEIHRLKTSERFRVRVDKLGLTINEAADLAGIGRNEFRELVRSGAVRSIKCGERGGRTVVPVAAVAEFLDGRTEARDGDS